MKSPGNEDIKYVHRPSLGVEFHRLKIKNDEFDHRIYFDYIDSETVVFAVRHRDYSYTKEDFEEIMERLEQI